MPTYLLAILISDFSCKTEKTTATIPSTPSVEINVCGRDNAKEFFDLPLEMSVKTLEYFESYLEYPYTLTKLGISFNNLVQFIVAHCLVFQIMWLLQRSKEEVI